MELSWLETPLLTLGDMHLSIYNVMFSAISLTIGVWLSRRVRSLLLNQLSRASGLDKSTAYTIATLAFYAITVVSVLVAISILGFDITNLAIVAGALSVGIGFGLQDIAKNFISGLLLLFDRSIKVGDFIQLANSDLRGTVEQIRVRSTIVKTSDDLDVIVPNSQFLSDQVINWTMSSDFMRLHVPFSVAYGSDARALQAMVLELAASLPGVVQNDEAHQPSVWFTAMADSSLNFDMLVWVKGNDVLNSRRKTSEYTFALYEALGNYGYEIPFPQRDLHIKSVAEGVKF